MLTELYSWLRGLFDHRITHLAIVRRYADADGSYVGELYRYDTFGGIGSYRLVGCSLDSLKFDLTALSLADEPQCLDLKNDFLAPMPVNTVRIGAAEPKDNDAVRQMISSIPRRNIRIVIQNKFIEHVLQPRKA